MKPSIIYVDMESLFDLRQGVLATLVSDKDAVVDYLLSEEYNFREIDEFKYTLPTSYNEIMKSPSKTILEHSCITRIFLSLKEKIETIERRNKLYNESKHPQILLNLYPFDFTEEEAERIRDLLFIKLDSECSIELANFPVSTLSPYYCKANGIASAFIYRFNEWMTHHLEAVKVTPIHDTILYFPALYHKLPNKEELSKINKLGFKDPMSYLEYLVSSVASINFLPVLFYSNLITALGYLEKFNTQLNDEFVEEGAEEKYGDIISKIPVP